MRQSEARFRSLTELPSDWHWRLDAQLRFVETDAEVARTTGIDSAIYVGKPPWELFSLSPGPSGWARLQATLEARQVFRDFEVRRRDVAGTMNWASTSDMPVFGPNGEFEGYAGVGRPWTVWSPSTPTSASSCSTMRRNACSAAPPSTCTASP
ncbi:MAG: PAS domain S-box protein [Rhizobacter sp.]|nr:PAS domain S-box protein [Rhizobacter sp.]